MSEKTEPGRIIETETEIAAPVSAVWKALTEARELARWFPLEADVEPGPGGSIWMSWGELFQGRSRIEIWEPERHLRVGWMQPEGESRPVRTAVDYYLEGRGGATLLRLVHSGFGRGESWHEEYDGTRRGWRFELRSLRHYLERHRGRDRRVAWSLISVPGSARAAWDRLTSEDGLLAEGSLTGHTEGDDYAIRTATGQALRGTVHVYDPPTDFSGTVHNLNDGLFRVGIERGQGDARYAVLWLATYGIDPTVVDEAERRLETLLQMLFG